MNIFYKGADMKITVYGAGAIGGCIGARMAEAGHHVILVDKAQEHVNSINARGLRLTGFGGDKTIAVRAILPEQLSDPGLVFLAVRSGDTMEALDTLMPHVGPETSLISLQNGMNPPVIASRIGDERTVGALVRLPVDCLEPGVVMQGKEGQIYIGELDGRQTDRVHLIRELLSSACPTAITDNIYGYLWAKLVWCCYAAVAAMHDEPNYMILECEKYRDLFVKVIIESITVARADGIDLEVLDDFDCRPFFKDPSKDRETMYGVLDNLAAKARESLKVKTTTWRDISVVGRETEVPWMTGYVVARGAHLGVPTPVNGAVVRIIKDLEQGKRSMGWHNLDELNAVVTQSG